MTWKSEYQKHLKIATPIAIGQFGHILVVIADSIMIGQLGAIPLAAASFTNSIFMLVFVFGYGLSFGVTPLVASADPKKEQKLIGSYLGSSLGLSFIVAILLSSISFAVVPFMHSMGQNTEVVDLAKPYFSWISYSLLPLLVFMFVKQYAEGLSLTKFAMLVSLIGNLINVLLNYILIFGMFGAPKMELIGAGIATFSARILMALAMLIYLLKHKDFAPYREKIQLFAKSCYVKILKIGIPSGGQFIFEVGAFSMGAIMVGWIGPLELAAHQIALSLAAATYLIASGLAGSATVRVGNAVGRKSKSEIRKAGFSAFHLSLFFMGGAAIVFLLGRTFFPSLYIDSPEVLEIATGLMVIAAFFQLSDGLQVTGLGALRGLEDVKIPTIVTFVSYWILGLGSSYLFAFHFNLGVKGVWYGFLIALSSAAISHLIRFHILSKHKLD